MTGALAAAGAPSWPAAVWAAPVVRELDDRARHAIATAGRLIERAAGAAIYRDGDASESLFIVIAGAVELRAIRRGDEAATVVRIARAGDSFGEEALLPGLSRRLAATAAAAGPVELAEIPVAVLRRVTARAADARAAGREQRYLERAAIRDLLACSALARDLDPADLELLVDATRLERFARGATLYAPGDRADAVYVVVEGLVQLQDERDRGPAITAYLARGDFFADQDAFAGTPRRAAAVAAGEVWCAIVRADAARTIADRNPGLVPRLRRVAEAHADDQAAVVGDAAARSTQHVFRDLYRMQIARSLLVIDQDSCVRCGHCAWSCAEVHDGVSRLIRRGDKVVTALAGATGAAGAANLLLPNTCQQCRHAACMLDCPTGAIGRDPAGEVFIRPDLCTGCGNCAKSCPWDNIQMAPLLPLPLRLPATAKATAAPPARATEVAVKCDLCRGFAAPACVEACPTGAVLRLDPSRDVAEVAAVLGLPTARADGAAVRRAPSGIAWSLVAMLGIVVAAAGWALHQTRGWTPSHGPGLVAGIAAGALILALLAYVGPKRRIRARMQRRATGARRAIEVRPAPRSRTRPHLIAHLVLGVVLPGVALAHAGARAPSSSGGALAAALALTTVIGVLAAVCYRLVPRALTRLERRGTLPEDLAAERDELDARLYRALTGAGDRIKAVGERIVLPYARRRLGAVALVASRRTLADEERRVRAGLDAALPGKTAAMTGLDDLIRIAVELRALPARRALTRALRIWPPIHIVTGAMTVALLVVHVAGAVLR